MYLLNSGLDHVTFNGLDDAAKDRLLLVQIDQFLIARIQQRNLVDFVLLLKIEDGSGELSELRVLLQKQNQISKLLTLLIFFEEWLHPTGQIFHRIFHLGSQGKSNIAVISDLFALVKIILDVGNRMLSFDKIFEEVLY